LWSVKEYCQPRLGSGLARESADTPGWGCLDNDPPAGPGLMWRQHGLKVRWIALRQQGDRTSAALWGGGAIP